MEKTYYFELFEKFKELNIDKEEIHFSIRDNINYFCTPIGANILAWEDAIHYCEIDGQGDTIFAVNPETCCDYYVYPIADNFYDFLQLIVSVGSANPVEQIINFDSVEEFIDFMNDPQYSKWYKRKEHIQVINTLKDIFKINPISLEDAYEYVKRIQNNFDYQIIKFSPEFYM